MPIEMPSGLPFSVDTWTTPSSKKQKKRPHFLTHAHRDHSQGISSHSCFPIYSTRLTKTLVLQHYPQLDESLFVDIEVGQTLVVDDPDGNFSVTAFDANHCPGAVMFLFEGNFGNILHTGDCRLTPETLNSLPQKYVASKKGKEPRCQLDCVFLDCTFGQSSLEFPSKYSAVRQVINCIWKHPNARVVYLSCDLLGQEDILKDVSKIFGSKIFVDKDKNPDYFHALTVIVPGVLSEDPSCRFHVLEGFPRLHERAKTMLAEAQANSLPEPLIIRPSTQWYVHDGSLSYLDGRGRASAVRDPHGVWHICYSMHSSREELEWALQLLAPKWVVSTTPSCRAMELSYARENCFGRQISSDHPIWKLLGLRPAVSPSSGISTGVVSSSTAGDSYESEEVIESQIELIKSFGSEREVLVGSSLPKKKPPVTLFGRARLGVPDFVFTDEFNQRTAVDEDHCCSKEESTFQLNDAHSKEPWKDVVTKVYPGSSVERKRYLEEKYEKSTADEVLCFCEEEYGNCMEAKMCVNDEQSGRSYVDKEPNFLHYYSHNGSSAKGFSDRFRKMCRLINVPVPEPLPSLVELMKAAKRRKTR